MSPDNPADIERQLAELHHAYLSQLDERLREINALLATGDLPKLAEALHRLRGSAATYGLADLSRAAGQAEEAARSAQEPELLRARIVGLAGLISRDANS